MVTYLHHLYSWLGPFERRSTTREVVRQLDQSEVSFDVLLFGLGRYGSTGARRSLRHGLSVLGVDKRIQSPITRWRRGPDADGPLAGEVESYGCWFNAWRVETEEWKKTHTLDLGQRDLMDEPAA